MVCNRGNTILAGGGGFKGEGRRKKCGKMLFLDCNYSRNISSWEYRKFVMRLSGVLACLEVVLRVAQFGVSAP